MISTGIGLGCARRSHDLLERIVSMAMSILPKIRYGKRAVEDNAVPVIGGVSVNGMPDFARRGSNNVIQKETDRGVKTVSPLSRTGTGDDAVGKAISILRPVHARVLATGERGETASAPLWGT